MDPPRSTATTSTSCPSMWSISYEALMELDRSVHQQFGTTAYSQMTMRDINKEIIIPSCQKTGISYALAMNPNGLKVSAFVTHSWDGIFPDFVQSIRSVFQTHVVKPNLWICAFALIQGDHKKLERQVSGVGLADSPFVKALAQANHFVVVRNTKSDLYSRIWCVCELIFAQSFGLVPLKTHVTGPDHFSSMQTSCLDAQSTEPQDKARILKFLLTEHQFQDIDKMVQLFRTQETPGVTFASPTLDSSSHSFTRLRSVLHPLHDEDEQLIAEQMKRFAVGTRDWVIQRFDNWLVSSTGESNNSRIFVLMAVAGVGKTGIMCKLSQDRADSVVASHFCRHDDDRRNNPKRMLLSLVYQLAQKFPEYKAQLEHMVEEGTLKEEALAKLNITSVFNELLKVPLGKLSIETNKEKYVILIDALDECESKGKNEILLCIQRHFLRLPPWLHVYLTTRPEVPVMEKLKRFNPKYIEPTRDENTNDLAVFYGQVLETERDKLVDGFDVPTAVQTLVEKSGGLFIYASFVADAIRRSQPGSITQQSVDMFPGDLDAYYEEQLDRICDSDPECLEWQIVQLVLTAAEPMHLEVIQAVLNCTRKELLEAVKHLSQLFRVDENWKMHTYHKSFVDFLTSEDRVYSDFYVNKEEQHRNLAKKCLELVEKMNLSKLPCLSYHAAVVSYVLQHGIHHLHSAGMQVEAKKLVTTKIEWLIARVQMGDSVRLVDDCQRLAAGDRTMHLIGRAINLSLNALRRNFQQLPSHLIGRLGGPAGVQRNNREGNTKSSRQASDDLLDFLDRVEAHEYGFDWHCPLSAAWDQADQPCLLLLEGFGSIINDLAFSPVNSQLASVSKGGSFRLWDSDTGEYQQSLRGRNGEISSVDFSPDGSRLVSGGSDSKLKIWDGETGKCEQSVSCTGSVYSVEWSRFGIIAAAHNTVSLWSIDSEKLDLKREIECCEVIQARMSPDGRTLIGISNADFKIRMFNTLTGVCERVLEVHTARVRSVAISLNNQLFASGSSDKTVCVFDLATANFTPIRIRDHGDSVFAVTFSPDSAKLVSGSYDNTVRIFDSRTGVCQGCLTVHLNSVVCLAMSSVTNRLATGSVDKTIRLWDVSRLQLDSDPDPIKAFGYVTSIVWSPDGSDCFVGSRNSSIRFFNPESGLCWKIVQTSGDVLGLAWSPNGLIAAQQDNCLKSFDFKTGEVKVDFSGHTRKVNCVAYMEEILASGSSDATVRIFEADTGKCKASLLGHSTSVRTVAFSPDGLSLASGSDTEIHIYNLASGLCEKKLNSDHPYPSVDHPHANADRAYLYANVDLAYSSDGLQLLCRSVNKKHVLIWTIETSTFEKMPLSKAYIYPPKCFQAFTPHLGIEYDLRRCLAPEKEFPGGIESSRVVRFGTANPCAVFRDGSVVFFKLIPKND